MAEIKSTKKDNPMLDPVAYRSDYPEESIIGDTPATVEVTEKYTGEGTNNVYHPYNRTLTIDQLDPNYKYGQPAKDINAIDDSYITRRNDQIASALYNEGKVTYDEVVGFLESQPNWFNSNEKDRENTKANVWNRIGQISSENDKKDTKDTKDEEKKSQWTGEEIYGKTTADEGKPSNGIESGTDTNAVLNQMEAWRVDNMNTLIQTPPKSIAAALESGTLSSNLQSVLDVQKYYPEYWAEVESYRKQLRGQDVVNAISKGEEIPTSTNTVSNANNSIVNSASDMSEKYDVSMTDTLNDVHQTLQSNSSAQGAKDTMAEIENEISDLNLKLKNLKKEANSIFSGDTPQYIVNAYITNRTQEIQDKLQVLSERYKYASNRYDKEVANAQWEKEYSLKERQVAVQESQNALSWWKESNGITTTTTTTNTNPTTTTSLNGKELPLTSKNRQEIGAVVDNLVKMYNNGQLGNAQCATGVQQYYLPQLGISFGTLSGWGEKLSIRNEGRDYTPQKGDLIIMASGTKPGNGHMGIVIGMTANGKIQYIDWNGDVSGDEKPAIREIDPNSAKIQGYYNATKGQNELQSGNQWTDYDYTRFEQYRDATSKTEKEAIAAEYGTNLTGMNNIVREALINKGNQSINSPEELTWFDYVGLTDEQIADIEKEIGYNPNIEWELKKIIDKGIPTSLPAMKNVLKTIRAKDEKQLGQWIDHYKNKVNAEALQAGEDILLLLAQLQNLYKDEDRVSTVTKDGKTKTVFDTNASQGWGWGGIGIKYNQLIKQLLLNKVTEAREKGATFGQMTEYEWKILEDAASALQIKFGYGSSDESFSEAFFDLVDATWKLTNGTSKGPTREEWNNYVNQVKNESQWYMEGATEDVSGSNLGGGQGVLGGNPNNEATKEALGIL